VLNCVVFDNSTYGAANNTFWVRDGTPAVIIRPDHDMRYMIENTRVYNVVISILTIESVSSSDNGTGYFCFVTLDDRSFNGMVSVTGEYVQYVNYYTVFVYRKGI